MKTVISSSEIDTLAPEELRERFQCEADARGIRGAGHNRKTQPGGIAVDQLRSIVERVEKLEEEKSAIGADIRDVFAEAKGNGFDVKAIRSIIRLRRIDAGEREEQETILDTYKRALGMAPQLELGLNDAEEADAD